MNDRCSRHLGSAVIPAGHGSCHPAPGLASALRGATSGNRGARLFALEWGDLTVFHSWCTVANP